MGWTSIALIVWACVFFIIFGVFQDEITTRKDNSVFIVAVWPLVALAAPFLFIGHAIRSGWDNRNKLKSWRM